MMELLIAVAVADVRSFFERGILTPRSVEQIVQSIGGRSDVIEYAVLALVGEGFLHIYDNPFGKNFYHQTDSIGVVWSEDGEHDFQISNPEPESSILFIIDPHPHDTFIIEPSNEGKNKLMEYPAMKRKPDDDSSEVSNV